MRSRDRQLSQADTEAILSRGVYGILSLNGEDDYAYGVPMSYVYKGDKIYLHCAMAGDISTRIQRDNRVSFCVVGKSNTELDKFAMEYSSAIVFGQANIVGEDEKFDVLLAFVDKYAKDHKGKGEESSNSAQNKNFCIRIDIERIVGGDYQMRLLYLLKPIL